MKLNSRTSTLLGKIDQAQFKQAHISNDSIKFRNSTSSISIKTRTTSTYAVDTDVIKRVAKLAKDEKDHVIVSRDGQLYMSTPKSFARLSTTYALHTEEKRDSEALASVTLDEKDFRDTLTKYVRYARTITHKLSLCAKDGHVKVICDMDTDYVRTHFAEIDVDSDIVLDKAQIKQLCKLLRNHGSLAFRVYEDKIENDEIVFSIHFEQDIKAAEQRSEAFEVSHSIAARISIAPESAESVEDVKASVSLSSIFSSLTERERTHEELLYQRQEIERVTKANAVFSNR